VSDSISPKDVYALIKRDICTIDNNVNSKAKRKIIQLSPNSVNQNREKERERGKKRRLDNKSKIIATQTPLNQPVYNIEIDGNIRNINSLNVIQIKKILREKKLNTFGPKDHLLERLAQVKKLISNPNQINEI